MPLVFNIAASDPALAESAGRRIEVGDRLTIGRGADNDLVLADPHRHLSKNHCVIDFDGHGGYTITDLSTNGVFLDDSAERLPRDAPVPLVEGSVLRLGGYQLTVAAIAPAHGAAPARGAAIDDGLFGDPLAAPLAARPLPHDLSGGANLGNFSGPPGPGSFAPVIPEDVDLFPGKKEPEPQWQGGSHPDHARADHAFFAPPRVVAEQIPDDFDLSLPGGPAMKPPARPAPSFSPAAAPEPASRPAAPPVVAAARAGGGGDAMAVANFLAALGIAGTPLSDAEKMRLMQLAGETLAATIKGLIEILAARANTKQEFRLDRTSIGVKRNNPLKFSESADEAIRTMLLDRTPGFLLARDAVEEALDDIKSHQLAVLAGMQAALAMVVARFDPDKLEKRLEQGSLLDGILPGARKARYWELFKTLYKEIATELQDDFQRAFGAEFARAYRAQIERLR